MIQCSVRTVLCCYNEASRTVDSRFFIDQSILVRTVRDNH